MNKSKDNKLRTQAKRRALLERAGRLWPQKSVSQVMWLSLKEAVERAEIARLRGQRSELEVSIRGLQAERSATAFQGLEVSRLPG